MLVFGQSPPPGCRSGARSHLPSPASSEIISEEDFPLPLKGPEALPGVSVAVSGRLAVPLRRELIVRPGVRALPSRVDVSQHLLRVGVAVPGGLEEPLHGLPPVARDAPLIRSAPHAAEVHHAEPVLGLHVPLRRGAPEAGSPAAGSMRAFCSLYERSGRTCRDIACNVRSREAAFSGIVRQFTIEFP